MVLEDAQMDATVATEDDIRRKHCTPRRTCKILPRMRSISRGVEEEDGEWECGLAYRVFERAFAKDRTAEGGVGGDAAWSR
jgi:hypothetical protein